jgi:hypothetical protein
VKETIFLLAIQRVVGGVKVEHQFLGCGFEAGDELLDQHLMQPPSRCSISPFLQTTQCRGAGHLAINTHCSLHRHVTAQCAVVVQVFPAKSQTIDALSQHVHHRVFGQQRTARISYAACRRLHQTKLAISRPEQHHPGIAGHAAAIKSTLHDSSAKVAKFNLAYSRFFGTVWHWRSQLLFGVEYQ